MFRYNKTFIVINKLDNFINKSEGELDFIKFRLIDFFKEKDLDLDTFDIKKEDIQDFLAWYENQKEHKDKVSINRCKEILLFMFNELYKESCK